MGVKYVRRCPRCWAGDHMRTRVVDGVREKCSLCQGDGYVSVEGSPIPPGIIGVQLSDDVKFYGRVRTHLEADPDDDTQPIDMPRDVDSDAARLNRICDRMAIALERIEASLRAIVDEGLAVRHG